MKFFALISILFPLIASAHIEKGTWKGSVREGVDCYMDAGDQSFVDGVHHPLNERIQVKVGAIEYVVHHPYSIDATTGTIDFNHDLFEGVVATPTGAYAIQINMIHSEDFEGPAGFSVMEHNWKTGFKELVICKSLKKVN